MSETPEGPGWWLASDGRYYPPQPPPPPPSPPHVPPGAGDPAGPPTADVPPQPGQAWAPPTSGPAAGAAPAPGTAWGAPSSGPVPPQGLPSAGSGGSTRAVLVVLGIVVVLVLGVVAVAAFLVAGSREERTVTADPEPLEQVPTTRPDPVDPGGGSVPAAADGSVEVAEIGFSLGEGFDGDTAANAGAVLRNVGPDVAAFFEVVFTFTDAAGAPVGTETAYVYAIDPGGVAHAAVDAVSLQGTATAVEATVVLDPDGFWSGATLPVEVTEVSVDDFFGLEVSGTASNPTGSTVQGGAVNCVVRRGGKIVGGTNAMLDSIAPGGDVAWDAIIFSDWLDGDAAECSGSFYE